MRRIYVLTFILVWTFACSERKQDNPSVQRFAAVAKKKKKSATSLAAFCEVFHDAKSAPAFVPPPSKPVPEELGIVARPKSSTKWKWVNVWASWCAPCVEEIPLFRQWQNALSKHLEFELWSMDEDGEKLVASVKKLQPMPGWVGWFDSPESVPKFFAPLGIESMSPIPVHILVDPMGKTRCVRVGKVSEEAYGAILSLVSSK
ncbi:MAG: hypothetical protein VYC39_01680 [Myxococcota bacterium]|nr:hypothetical protein [Myxococcota bacterium]